MTGQAVRVEWPVLVGSLARRLFLTVPWKYPPSTSAMRGAMTSPSSEPVSRISTFSRAVTLPVTEPLLVTILAQIRAGDPAGRADRQNVLRQFDRAGDLAIKGQSFGCRESPVMTTVDPGAPTAPLSSCCPATTRHGCPHVALRAATSRLK